MAATVNSTIRRFGALHRILSALRAATSERSTPACTRALVIFILLFLSPVLDALGASTGDGKPLSSPLADSILIIKSEHRLYLIRDGRPLRSYTVALGLSPVGPKRQEYDFRTPEGRYIIDARRPNSHYFRALHVSYPNTEDRKQAAERHVSAGGDIMIHGLPNVMQKPLSYYQTQDWTNGCIALSNEDLLEVWALVHDRIPVEIRP
jgi:murein L,D-transpeptidase YafK